MLKCSLTALLLVASFPISEAQSAEPNEIKDCLAVRGRDAKIRCLVEVSKALDARLTSAETKLEDSEKKLTSLASKVDALEKLEIKKELGDLKKNTVKLDGSYHLIGLFRGQCMQWVDTGKPPNFVGCNNDPDQNFRFQ